MSDNSKATRDTDAPAKRWQLSPTRIGFVVFMLALTALFAWLGTWQMARLAQKEQALALIAERIDSAPIPLPAVGEWVGFDAETFDYRPVTMTGRFAHDDTVLVFTSIGEPRGQFGGPGYWVMTPFELTAGGTVWVNRGFVPDNAAEQFIGGGAGPEQEMTITGIGRRDEPGNTFTPGPDIAGRIEWIRNVARLTDFLDEKPSPLAPIYVDQIAGEPGSLPQGGETRLTLPNRHFEYALTWFSLAILTPIMILVWWRRGAGG